VLDGRRTSLAEEDTFAGGNTSIASGGAILAGGSDSLGRAAKAEIYCASQYTKPLLAYASGSWLIASKFSTVANVSALISWRSNTMARSDLPVSNDSFATAAALR